MLKIGPNMAFLLILQKGTILKAFYNRKQWNFSKSCSGNTTCQESPNLGILQNISLHMVNFGFLTAHTSGNSKLRGPPCKKCFCSLFWLYYLASHMRFVILNKPFFQNKTFFPAGIQTTVLQQYMNYPLRQMSKFITTQTKIVSTVFSSGLQAIKTKEVM